MRRGLRAFLDDDAGTSSAESILLTGFVSLPLFFVFVYVLKGLAREFEFIAYLFSQAGP